MGRGGLEIVQTHPVDLLRDNVTNVQCALVYDAINNIQVVFGGMPFSPYQLEADAHIVDPNL